MTKQKKEEWELGIDGELRKRVRVSKPIAVLYVIASLIYTCIYLASCVPSLFRTLDRAASDTWIFPIGLFILGLFLPFMVFKWYSIEISSEKPSNEASLLLRRRPGTPPVIAPPAQIIGKRCANCRSGNPPQNEFCATCGTPLVAPKTISNLRACPRCGTDNASQNRFCGKCGNSMEPETGE